VCSKKRNSGNDEVFREALRKAYAERAKLFVRSIRDRDIRGLINSVSVHQSHEFQWDLQELGVAQSAFDKLVELGIQPHMVFCHPDVIDADPQAMAYYRNLAAVSAKGLNQMVRGLKGVDRKRASIQVINQILSSIIEETEPFDLALIQAVIPAEIGTEIQGTWVNIIGQGAAKRVQAIITNFVVVDENRALVLKRLHCGSAKNSPRFLLTFYYML